MTEKIQYIPARQKNAAVGGHIGGTEDIIDDVLGKEQNQINQETIQALNDRYTKDETYNKTELDSMITTPNQEYVTLTASDGDTLADIFDGVTGAADTIYRVGSWDGEQYDATVYSEYAFDGTNFVYLSTKTQIGEVFDISLAHASGGELAKYADLEAALGTNGANVPEGIRKGGMSVKFVQSSDNKYVQYRYMLEYDNTTDGNAAFVNPTNWQASEELPRASNIPQPVDFAISDENGNSIVRFLNGEIKTKNFDSTKTAEIADSLNVDLDIKDEHGYSIAKFIGGHIKTKNFDSRNPFVQSDKNILESQLDFISWTNSGFTASSDNVIEASDASPSSVKKMNSNKEFALDNRELSVVFKFTEADSKLLLGTKSGAKFSSAIGIDTSTSYLYVYGQWTGENEPTPLLSYNIESLAYNKVYKLVLGIHGRGFDITLLEREQINCSPFTQVFHQTIENETLGYLDGAPYYGYEYGSWKGPVHIRLTNGGIKIYGFQHSALCACNPFIYILGDSITEGFGVHDADRYGQLIRDRFGKYNVIMSAIGGDSTTSVMGRFNNEMARLKPSNAIIFLGTNTEDDTIFENNYRSIITSLKNKNTNLFLCTIPTSTEHTQIIEELAVEYNAKVIDIASLLKHNGSLITDYYTNYTIGGNPTNDNMHPNSLGHYVIATEICNSFLIKN